MPTERSHPLLAVALTIVMSGMFAAMDTLVGRLGAVVPMLLLLAWRYATQAVLVGLWLLRGGLRPFASARPGFQALRAVLLLLTSGLSFVALQHLPVAEFTAVMLLGPVFVTILAALVLHESISRLRWVLVGLSLLGALIVIRPGSGLFGWATLLPLAGAGCNACFQILTRRLALSEDAYATHFWTGAAGTLVLLPMLAASDVQPGPVLGGLAATQWVALVTIGVLGTTGHLLLVLAARMAPTSTLMPFIYVQLGFASLFGWLATGRLPDFWGWCGMAVIAASGAAAAWLNTRLTKVSRVTIPRQSRGHS